LALHSEKVTKQSERGLFFGKDWPLAHQYYKYGACLLLSLRFISSPLFSVMELELSLGVSPALAKGTVKHMLTCTRAGDGEGHELVLELGLRTAKGDELNNLKTSMQPEDMQEEDLYKGCPLPTASAETGTKEFYMSESARLARYLYDRLWLKHIRAPAVVG